MSEISGPAWCDRFPGINTMDALDAEWRPKLVAFIEALENAGAHVKRTAIYRPPQRAYLMHFACAVGGWSDKRGIEHAPSLASDRVTPMPGVDIDWTHGGDRAAARRAARAMVRAYGIVFPAALISRHTHTAPSGTPAARAIDMTISWVSTLRVRGGLGGTQILTGRRDGMNPQLWVVGKSYGVLKLASDAPHWSTDGH